LQPEFTLSLLYGPDTLLTEEQVAVFADYWDEDTSFEENIAAVERWLPRERQASSAG
jgi:predicted DNA-binding protein YlxM (UPF0122 family)